MTLESTTRIERLAAAKNGSGKWDFGEVELSTLFTYCLGESWKTVMYAPYYKEFWSKVIEKLDKHGSPAELELHVTYSTGIVTETELEKSMEEWRTNRMTRTKPNALVVSEADDDKVTAAHMLIEKIEVSNVRDS